MKSYDIEFAKELKKRNNENFIGIIQGTVVSTDPLKISIYGGRAFFTEENIYLCNNIKSYTETVNVTINGTTYQGTVEHKGLKVNDIVTVIGTEDNQKLFVIDKL